MISTTNAPAAALVTLEVLGKHLAIVTLNRPAARNAISAALTSELEKIVARVESDEDIRAAIITGAGDRAFCAGADLREVAEGGLPATFTAIGGFAAFVNARREKPWIAAVNGVALAGGFEIVLACDLVIASEDARFGLPEVKRGLIASAGGLYRLPRALPKAVAIELITTGGTIDAERAYGLGLVNRVVEKDRVLEAAMQIAHEICANAPLAVRQSLALARLASRFEDAALRAKGDEAQDRLSRTADFSEGARAFIEKRQPRWLGR